MGFQFRRGFSTGSSVIIRQTLKPGRFARLDMNERSPVTTIVTDRNTEHTYLDQLIGHLLPKDYKSSVKPGYIPYVQWSMVASITGTISSVLSMEALLFSMGVGAGAIPMAAALNWIIKDGLGQFGGMLCASFINRKFDADPKRWRLMASVLLDASVLLEVLTPLCPQYFLPIASVANVGKNVGWISASASRAGIHRSFMKAENLADITGKAGR